MTTKLKILAWAGLICLLIALAILLSVKFAGHTPSAAPSTFSIPWGLVLIGIAVVATIGLSVYYDYRRSGLGLTSIENIFRWLSIICAIVYLVYAIQVHERLGTAVFNAYFYTVGHISLALAIVGLFLASWLFRDVPAPLPIRKIFGVLVTIVALYGLCEFLSPNIPWSSLWNAYWQVILGVGAALILLLLLIPLLSSSKGQSFLGNVVLIALTALAIIWMFERSQAMPQLPQEVKKEEFKTLYTVPVRPGNMPVTVSTKGYIKIPFPPGGNWIRGLYGPNGEDDRPVDLECVKDGVKIILKRNDPGHMIGLPTGLSSVKVKAVWEPGMDTDSSYPLMLVNVKE